MSATIDLARPVSGQQWTISADGHEATVVEVGGGLREYRAGGVDVVDGFGPDEMCPASAGQILAPWPNRIRDGRYPYAGFTHQLPLTEPARHTALHGLVNWARWRMVEVRGDAVTLEHDLVPQPGYPWSLLLRTTWQVGASGADAAGGLGGAGLSVFHEVTNTGTTDAPFGLAVHPYVRVAEVPVDDLVLEIPALSRVLLDGRLLPIGTARVSGTEFDYTAGRRIGETVLDAAFGDVSNAESGRSTTRLLAPDGRGVACWADSSFRWWQVFTGDTLAAPRRRRAVAIEPMTCPPDAFRSGRDVVTMKPGDSWRGAWGLYPIEG